jgi:hypothetical protein
MKQMQYTYGKFSRTLQNKPFLPLLVMKKGKKVGCEINDG